MALSINSYIAQILAGQPKKPSPIHDALQAIQNWASAGLVDADIAAGAAIAISKTMLGTYTPWTTWTPGYTGFSTNPVVSYAKYCQIGKMVIVVYVQGSAGISNATTFTISGLPVAASAGLGVGITFYGFKYIDATVWSASPCVLLLPASATSMFVGRDLSISPPAWTASGYKGIDSFVIMYPTD